MALSSGGNSVLVRLPAGTRIEPPDNRTRSDLLAGLIDRAEAVDDRVLALCSEVDLCTPEYLQERDAVELSLHRRVRVLETRIEGGAAK